MERDSQHLELEGHAEYSAPIPPPAMLERYYALKPEYADTIFKMAQDNNTATIEIAKKSLDSDIRHKSRGQWLAFAIVVIGYAMAGVFAFVLKNTPMAITSIVSGTVPLAIAGVQGFLK